MPGRAPVTKEKWEEWKQVWPITWRVPDVSSLPPDVGLDPQEERAMWVHMRRAWELSAAAAAAGNAPNAAVIVDPVSGTARFMHSGTDSLRSRPCRASLHFCAVVTSGCFFFLPLVVIVYRSTALYAETRALRMKLCVPPHGLLITVP